MLYFNIVFPTRLLMTAYHCEYICMILPLFVVGVQTCIWEQRTLKWEPAITSHPNHY